MTGTDYRPPVTEAVDTDNQQIHDTIFPENPNSAPGISAIVDWRKKLISFIKKDLW